MSGFQFVTLFRVLAGCGAVPVVAVSGSPCPEHIAHAWDTGIRHCLLKPADLVQLRALLGALTRRAARPDRRVTRRTVRHGVRPAIGWGRMA